MKLGTIKGIGIKLHFSTILIVGLVGFYASVFFTSLQPDASFTDIILVAIANGIIILLSILIHELAHSLMANRYGLKVSEIELYLFGGVSKIEEEPRTPKSEFIISGVGPLSSIILGAIFLTLYAFMPFSIPAWIVVTLLYSGISNIGLGFFNLLPAFPMDGGRVLRAYLWQRRRNILSATKTASRIGSFIGYSLMIYGFAQIFLFGLFGGFWLILIGSFLNNSAKKSYIQTVNEVTLSNINIRDIMGAPQLSIPYDTNIDEAIRKYFMIYKRVYFPVSQEGNIIGIIHLEDLKKIAAEQRPYLKIGDYLRSLSEFPSIYLESTGKDALKKLVEMKTLPHVVIVREEDDHIIGFVGEQDLYNAIRFCQMNPECIAATQ
ncbi:MAG: site-2 protease family protein [Promethearchaeota archaeon]|nr:MAG: site-2 protease family protein [Candidatus Lokiarchaeota archaeon]